MKYYIYFIPYTLCLIPSFLMLPKKQKISRTLFPKYADKKNTWSGVCLRIFCYEKKQPQQKPRFTVVVSKKQYKTVVARNLFKRQVFSFLQKNKDIFTEFQYEKYVIYPKLSVEMIDQKKIAADIKKLSQECST